MRHLKQLALAGGVAALAAAAMPAVAGAHGSVFATTAQLALDRDNPANLTPQTQYVITNHGHTYVLREDNGATRGGMLNYKVLPGAYRRTLTRAEILAAGDTGAQPHATCRTAALETEDAILAWQDSDPFYNYVPFQSTDAGLDDDPASWIAVVRDAVGVDLTGLDAAAAQSACEALPGPGTYVAADGVQTAAASLASGQTGPLNAQIAELTSAKEAVEAAKAGADAALAALGVQKSAVDRALAAAKAEVERLAKDATPLSATLASRRVAAARLARSGVRVQLSGPPNRRVVVRLRVNPLRAKALGLRTPALARAVVRTGADGAGGVTLKATRASAARLAAAKRGTAFTVSATSGDRAASARGTATR